MQSEYGTGTLMCSIGQSLIIISDCQYDGIISLSLCCHLIGKATLIDYI
mgnify:CR=1 FL=1